MILPFKSTSTPRLYIVPAFLYALVVPVSGACGIENNKLLVFFDRELNVIGDIHSYGHDIEATWLLDRACDVMGDKDYIEKWKNINLRISKNASAWHP